MCVRVPEQLRGVFAPLSVNTYRPRPGCFSEHSAARQLELRDYEILL